MGIEQRINLWHDLSRYSSQLALACESAQKSIDLGNEQHMMDIREMVRVYRETLAVLHLLRHESELLEALIGHDFLDRFTAIHLRLDQLTRRPSRELLDKVCRTLWVIRQVIESLVFWVDHQTIKLEKVDLGDYVLKNSPLFQETFPGVSISGRVEEAALVLMYPAIISNFVVNSIVNSIKHGTATKIELIAGRRHDSATLCMQDDGIGIDVPYRDIIAGLGLLMIEKRLEVMDALLEVEEHGGIHNGALFRIVFPIAQEQVKEKVVELPPPDLGDKG